MTEADILKALSNVQEPDLGKDLVTLNMVKNIAIDGNNVSFTIVLTTPACPMKDLMRTASENAVKILVNKEAIVKVDFTANTTSTRKDNQQILAGVKNIIAVVSGKGGVGKSTVSANLALALAEGGASVGLMDADIYGPSVPIMFGVRGERPMMKEVNGKGVIVPLQKFGIRLMSIGLLVDEKKCRCVERSYGQQCHQTICNRCGLGRTGLSSNRYATRNRGYTPYFNADRSGYRRCNRYHSANGGIG